MKLERFEIRGEGLLTGMSTLKKNTKRHAPLPNMTFVHLCCSPHTSVMSPRRYKLNWKGAGPLYLQVAFACVPGCHMKSMWACVRSAFAAVSSVLI